MPIAKSVVRNVLVELNTKLGIEPPLEINHSRLCYLFRQIQIGSKFVKPTDKLTPQAWRLIEKHSGVRKKKRKPKDLSKEPPITLMVRPVPRRKGKDMVKTQKYNKNDSPYKVVRGWLDRWQTKERLLERLEGRYLHRYRPELEALLEDILKRLAKTYVIALDDKGFYRILRYRPKEDKSDNTLLTSILREYFGDNELAIVELAGIFELRGVIVSRGFVRVKDKKMGLV